LLGLFVAVACSVGSTVPAGAARATSSAQLVPVTSVPGTIFDISSSAILWEQGNTLYLRDRASGTDTTLPPVFANASAFPIEARLTTTGALVEVGNGAAFEVEEWRRRLAIDRGPVPHPATMLAVAGQYATWASGTPASAVMEWRKMGRYGMGSTGTAVDPTGDQDVAANGHAFYSSATGDLLSFNGRRERVVVAHESGAGSWMPLTDGTNVVYQHGTPCCPQNQRGRIELRTSTGTTALTPVLRHGPQPYFDYQIAGGWVAYRADDGRALHVRSPDGVDDVVSSAKAHLLALNDAGQVIYEQGRTHDEIALPGASPVRLPSNFPVAASAFERGRGDPSGFTVWMDGAWYVVQQGSVSRLDLVPRPATFPAEALAAPDRARR
jgi:hypothetical protein